MEFPQLIAIILCSLIIQIEGNSTLSTCGQLPSSQTPFITRSSPTHHWPWHVAIYHRFNRSTEAIYKCSGTVISSEFILTAAHCVSKENKPMELEQVTLSLGSLNLYVDEAGAQWFEVADIILHSNFSAIDFNNDIAIVRLTVAATFNNYVQPVCLWNPNTVELSQIIGKSGTVVGWGQTEAGEISKELRYLSIPVVEFYRCLYSNRRFFGAYKSETNFCAGLRNGTSVCFGDSGGSMTFEANGIYFIRGIVSVGPSKVDHAAQKQMCDSMQFVLFTDVAKYLLWIIERSKIYCELKIQCDMHSGHDNCVIGITITESELHCKIIFDEISNPEIKILIVRGQLSGMFPDLADAADKFENLNDIQVDREYLKTVDRSRLAAFGRILKLKLNNNDLSELEAATFDVLNELKELELSFNNLTELPANLFKKLQNLKNLFLSNNQLEFLSPDIFSANQKLKNVLLFWNNLKELPANLFKELQNLESLGLGGNQFAILPQGLFDNNRKLKDVNLQQNGFKEFPENLFKELHDLEKLSLSNNQFEVLPPGLFDRNAKLQFIDLHKNNSKELPANIFKELPDLVDLWLGINRFEFLPQGLFDNNAKLEIIDLQENRISKIECDFHNLPNLNILTLRGNVCIDEYCDGKTFCGTNSSIEMNKKIRRNC